MSILTTVLVTFFAGMGAGLGTGFARDERRRSHQPHADHLSGR